MSYIFSICALLSLLTNLSSIENAKHIQIQSTSDIVIEKPGEPAVTVSDELIEFTVSEDSQVLIEKGLEMAEWQEESKTSILRFRHEYLFHIEEDGKRVVSISGNSAVVSFKISIDG